MNTLVIITIKVVSLFYIIIVPNSLNQMLYDFIIWMVYSKYKRNGWKRNGVLKRMLQQI